MDFNKILQILSLVMSSLTSQGLKTDDFLFVCLLFLIQLLMVYLFFFFIAEVEFSHFTA